MIELNVMLDPSTPMIESHGFSSGNSPFNGRILSNANIYYPVSMSDPRALLAETTIMSSARPAPLQGWSAKVASAKESKDFDSAETADARDDDGLSLNPHPLAFLFTNQPGIEASYFHQSTLYEELRASGAISPFSAEKGDNVEVLRRSVRELIKCVPVPEARHIGGVYTIESVLLEVLSFMSKGIVVSQYREIFDLLRNLAGATHEISLSLSEPIVRDNFPDSQIRKILRSDDRFFLEALRELDGHMRYVYCSSPAISSFFKPNFSFTAEHYGISDMYLIEMGDSSESKRSPSFSVDMIQQARIQSCHRRNDGYVPRCVSSSGPGFGSAAKVGSHGPRRSNWTSRRTSALRFMALRF